LVAGPAGTIPQDLVGLRAKGVHEASVLKVLALSGAGGITEDEADHVVRKLRRDGLIMGPTRLKLDIFDDSTALTVRGRYEVEQWLAEPDEPTAALPLPANQVFHIENMHVTGTLMQGSTATNVNTHIGTSGAELVELVAQFRHLLAGADVSPDDREEIKADLEVIEEEATAAKPRWARLRPFLRRLRGVLEKGALAAIEASTKQDVTHLIDKAEHAIAALQ